VIPDNQIMNTVRLLKEDLLKELARPTGDGRAEKILDILERLDRVDNMNLAILSETLIGASVSKLKTHDNSEVASAAKSLVKKWKGIAKRDQGGNAASSQPAASKSNNESKISSEPGDLKRMGSSGSSELNADTEWLGLPPLRINICKKLHTIFLTSKDELSKELNKSAVEQLCLARAGEVEAAIDSWSRGVKEQYTEKVRGLVFNLKKNGAIRDQVILGQISPDQLPRMSDEELQTEEKAQERDATVRKLQDSRRLDWDQANEKKINDMCGIKGELLKASLFTCGRCKSIKTTSTQKQTRSADEPMTVFVLCMNCGNRWKC
jgi:transcription elongation factor S-II